MIQDLPIPEQRQADRREYLSAIRAATTARAHASYFEALAADVTVDARLGEFAEQAATTLRRGYCGVALKLLTIAAEADERAASYLELLGVEQ